MQPELNVLAHAIVKFDGNVVRVLENIILHGVVGDRLARVVLAADAEQYLQLGKYLEKTDGEAILVEEPMKGANIGLKY